MIKWFSSKNLFIKLLVIYISCGIIAFAAMCLVFLLPIDRIQTNLNSAIPQLKSEGLSYHVTSADSNQVFEFFCNYKSTQLDNFTEAMRLLIASHDSDRKFFQAALLDEYYEVDGVGFKALIGEEGAYYIIYPRYWHGYLLYLKPLLFLTSYLNIRKIIFIIETLLLLVSLFLCVKKKQPLLTIPFIAIWTFIGPVAMSKSMQYFDMYLITMIEMILILACENLYKNNSQNLIIHFFIAGCATSFIDFLTYPLVAFGAPIALLIFLYGQDFLSSFMNLIKTGIAWAMGYVLFWAGKWIGGSIILKYNILSDAASSIALRTSDSVYGEKITYLSVLSRNLSAKPGQLILPLTIALILFITYIIMQKKTPSNNEKMSSKAYLYLIIALAPFAWYLVIKNHSYEHFFFTFRELSITVFSLWMFVISIIRQLYQNNQHNLENH